MAISDIIDVGADLLDSAGELLQDAAPVFALWTAAAVAVTALENLGNVSSQHVPDVSGQQGQIERLEGQKKKLLQNAAADKTFKGLKNCTAEYLEQIQSLRHELFLGPGELDEVRCALRQAEDYMAKGQEQLALMEMQRACLLAQSVYDTLHTKELEWEQELEKLEGRRAQIESLEQQCPAYPVRVQTTAGEEHICIDVDYWTDGKLRALHRTYQPVSRDLPTAELRTLYQSAQEHLDALQQLPQQALDAFCASQLRREICISVHDTLKEHGWNLVKAGYREQDERGPASLQMENAARDAMRLTVSGAGECRLRAVFDKVGNINVQQQLAEMLLTAMRESGFSVEHVQVAEEL